MGIIPSIISQSFPPKLKYSDNDIPDLSGKVVIVTGGNSGIGKEIAKVLLRHNAKVYVAARASEKTDAALKEIKADTGKDASFIPIDLGSLASVKEAAHAFLKQEKELHILYNNAGVMWLPLDKLTEEGYDYQFGVHVVGHHLFTKLLMPALLAGAQTSQDKKARVVTTSSAGAYFDVIHWDALLDGPARRKMSTQNLYYQSKFAQVVWARELARRYGDKGIISFSLNPGNIKTDLHRYTSIHRSILDLFLYPVASHGASTLLFAGTSPTLVDQSGKFLIPWARIGELPKDAKDPETAEKLWTWLDEQVSKFI